MVLASSGYLWKALYASLFRVVCGFALAVTVGVSLGVAMARIRLVNDFFDLVELPRPISPLALFPLAILWFGIGDGSKIFVIALAASFPVILNTFAGARSIRRPREVERRAAMREFMGRQLAEQNPAGLIKPRDGRRVFGRHI